MDIDLLSRMVREIILEKDRVELPGLGTFVTEMVPSSFSDRGYTINPPYRRLYFRSKFGNDTALAVFYAASNHIATDVAGKILEDFLNDLKQVLKEKKTVVFPGLGRLRATKENNFFFVPDEDLDIFPEGFGLAPVSLKTHQETRAEVAAAVEGLKSIMDDGEGTAPEAAREVPQEPETPETTLDTEIPQNTEAPQETRPGTVPENRRMHHAVKAVLAAVCAIILLTALYVVLNLIFPGLFDSLLYDPDQLEILDYVSE